MSLEMYLWCLSTIIVFFVIDLGNQVSYFPAVIRLEINLGFELDKDSESKGINEKVGQIEETFFSAFM